MMRLYITVSFTDWRIHQTCSLSSQTDYCFERTPEGTHQRFQSTVFFKTTIFTCPVHLSVLPFLCTAFGQRCDNDYNNLRSPKGGMLFELRFISWFLHSGNSPKIHKMCGHKLWTTIIVSCLDVDEDEWCNSLCKYETKIPDGNRTADPLSCVLASKYDELNTMDQAFL